MKLVKLKDTNGKIAYLNPDHLVLVAHAEAGGGVPSIGVSAVLLVNGQIIAAKGTPEEVSQLIEGGGLA